MSMFNDSLTRLRDLVFESGTDVYFLTICHVYGDYYFQLLKEVGNGRGCVSMVE